MEKEYLTIDEQFKDPINNEEIDRIADPELRDIRGKYWRMRHDAFMNEHGIPDDELTEVFARIQEMENAAIARYREKHNV